jgi:hypothetical protein
MADKKEPIRIILSSRHHVHEFLKGHPEVEVEFHSRLDRELKQRFETISKAKIDSCIERELREYVGSYHALTQKAEAAVKAKVNERIKGIEDAVIPKSVTDAMNAMVARAAERIEHSLQDAILTDRINKMVDQRIKERMGIK